MHMARATEALLHVTVRTCTGGQKLSQNTVTPRCTIKSFEMVVEILELQLRFSRVNRWAQRSQIATCLVSSQTEVESVPLIICICQSLQSCLCSLELHLIIVRRYGSHVRSQPGIGLIARRGNDEQCAAIHYTPEEC